MVFWTPLCIHKCTPLLSFLNTMLKLFGPPSGRLSPFSPLWATLLMDVVDMSIWQVRSSVWVQGTLGTTKVEVLHTYISVVMVISRDHAETNRCIVHSQSLSKIKPTLYASLQVWNVHTDPPFSAHPPRSLLLTVCFQLFCLWVRNFASPLPLSDHWAPEDSEWG